MNVQLNWLPPAPVSQQRNAVDCGLFCLFNALNWLHRVPFVANVQQGHVARLRRHFALAMLKDEFVREQLQLIAAEAVVLVDGDSTMQPGAMRGFIRGMGKRVAAGLGRGKKPAPIAKTVRDSKPLLERVAQQRPELAKSAREMQIKLRRSAADKVIKNVTKSAFRSK